MDNDIARFFRRHNIIELKNPQEALNINVIWKVIFAYLSVKNNNIPGVNKEPLVVT